MIISFSFFYPSPGSGYQRAARCFPSPIHGRTAVGEGMEGRRKEEGMEISDQAWNFFGERKEGRKKYTVYEKES